MPLAAPPPIETRRLLVRSVSADDVDELMTVNGDDAVTRFLPYATWQTTDDGHAWLARMQAMMDAGSALQFVIAERTTGKPIGTCLLFRHDETSRRAELGYALARAHWGRGLMHEALSALIDTAFGALHLRRLEAEVDTANAASDRVLRRLGFVAEGLMRQRWQVKGRLYDTRLYGLLAQDRGTTAAAPG